MTGLIRYTAAAAVSIAALLAAGAASASSFSLRSGSSAEGLGMAFAGAASGGIGMGAMAWNPATITMFPGRNSNWNLTYIGPSASYDPTSVTQIRLPNGAVVPINAAGGTQAGTGEIGGDGAFVPASYSAWQLTDRFWIGLTTGAPYGLRSKPDNQFNASQMYGRSARVGTYNVSPTIGYQVNDWLSIGAALQIQYFKTNLKQAVLPSAASPNTILEGDSTDFGFRLGATLTPFQGTTIGIAYRSMIHHSLDGTFTTPAAVPPILQLGSNPIKANLNLPDSVVFGLSQVINDQWQAHLGVEWTNWSRFRRIPIVSSTFGVPFTSLNFEYDDSWYFSVGAEYKYNKDLTLRAGVAYELSAVNDTNRTVFISDNDRLWLSAGMSYQVTDKIKLDLGYSYIHVQNARVNYSGAHPQQGAVLYTAEAKPEIHILSAGLTYRWDDPTQTLPAPPVVRKN